MKKLITLVALCTLAATSVAAQNSKTTSKMLYHDGPVLTGGQNIYMIWYGCWNENCGLLGDTSNGARANIRLGLRDFLIQQNWVNDRRPHCGMSR